MRDLIYLLGKPKRTLAGAVLIIIAFFGYSYWIQADLPTQMPLIIGRQLNMELTSEAATNYLHVSEPNSQPTAQESSDFDATKQAIDHLQIVSLEKRGWGTRVVVKAIFHLDGKLLPGGEDTRYYRLNFSWINGWCLPVRVTEGQYQRAWLFLSY